MKYTTVVRADDKSSEIEKKIRDLITINYDEKNPDYVIAVGGDGTIIKASHQYPNAIIFGVHTGHLGFYANYSIDTLEDLINDINTSKFECQSIDLIQCELINGNKKRLIGNALNEVSIITPLKTLLLGVYVDGEFLETFRGTGLCVSTSFGSTAYNKSLNGAVVDTAISSIQLTEIAGINSNAYRTLASPLVLSSNRVIELTNNEINKSVHITVDHENVDIKDFTSIKISSSKNKIKMAYHKYEDHLKRIRRTFLK